MSYEPVPEGDLAAVVTYLEMKQPPVAAVSQSDLEVHRIEQPSADQYRTLFTLVGAPWLWFSRLAMDDGQLTAIIHNPAVELFAIRKDGRDVGMLELDFRETGECEIAFIGLVPELAGMGHGRWLLSEAVEHAWREGVTRVHVHTCSLDHPAALSAYRRAGFIPFKRAIEQFRDPRLAGILPRDCAPQIPLLGTDG